MILREVLRERETLSLPRRSRDRNRGRVATAHIDAIIVALIKEGLQVKGSREGGSGGGGGNGSSGGKFGVRNSGSRAGSSRGGSGSGSGSRGCGSGGDRRYKGVELTDAEVGSIIAHVNNDQSTEVDAQVGGSRNAHGIFGMESMWSTW